MDKAVRAERKREYKERSCPAGVYSVTNTVSGRRLVGSSMDVTARLNRHKAQLAFGSHPNRALTADWKEYGESAFAFETLELLGDDYDNDDKLLADLTALEQLYIDKYQPFDDNGYNKR